MSTRKILELSPQELDDVASAIGIYIALLKERSDAPNTLKSITRLNKKVWALIRRKDVDVTEE